jgi:N-acetylneuraminic acid mutarotase
MKKILLLSLISFNLFSQNWSTIATNNTCTNRHENSFVAVGNQLVLVGGRGIKPVETFDIKTNLWSKSIDTPIEMHHFQAIEYKKELWIMGAFTGGYPHEAPIANIYIYNLKKKQWRIGPLIPKERQRGAAAVFVYNSKIYMSCGITDGHWDGHVAWLDEYNPKTNTWSQLPDAPHARDHVQAVVINNKIYLAAGRRSSAKINKVFDITEASVDVFDFETNTWATLPEAQNIPTQRAGTSSIVIDNNLVVIGGESGATAESHNEVEVLNTKTMVWEKMPSLIQGRHGTSATILKGNAYIAAGSGRRGGGPELNSIEVFSTKK